ncbi:hypothetical protein CFC21_082713 [Triticum aestivum]|uniref:Uncharacterized protein n=3 Tax=Triticum TaxID=4564 RepID=A0A9R1AXP6_TRITD|nr:hypothetical protein CFC21_082713 [Triticum aestivum]VAI44064.1 unnamed protein product [Triticum turgidum subsp. durum]
MEWGKNRERRERKNREQRGSGGDVVKGYGAPGRGVVVQPTAPWAEASWAQGQADVAVSADAHGVVDQGVMLSSMAPRVRASCG